MTDLEQSLLADIPKLNADSQAFMRWILDRVIGVGMRDYGPWQAAKDSRDMDREIADELADAVVYAGMQAVKRSLNKSRLVEEFKSATCDHWNELVEQDVCTGCGENAFDSVAYDALPTDSYLSAQAHAIAAFDFSDEEVTSQFRVEPLSNTASLESSISAASVDGSTPLDHPPTPADAAPISCVDCGFEGESGHHDGCPWVVVIPARRGRECGCNEKFRTAEDYRDHLPCEVA